MATQAERNAKIAEEAARQRNLERALAQVATAKETLSTAQSGARTTTGQTIFDKALAGLPNSYDLNSDVAKGLAASSARYGLQAADLNAYTGENIGYNISEQTKAEQAALDAANALAGQYGTPINIPTVTTTTGKNSAYDLLLAQFQLYGLGGLVEPLKDLITNDTSEGELTLLLRQSEPYKKRFAANAARIGKGLRALSEAEYLSLEDGYQSIMRNYGLPASYYAKGDLGRQEGFEKFIAGDVSPAELEERVLTAQNRVLNAPSQVKEALQKFYPDINNSDILAYTLDPEKGLADIKRKVTAAEIGGAAMGAGLATDVTRAEELAKFGITAERAREGYQAAVPIIERGRQLSSFYNESPYTQTTAEEEIFGLTGAAQAGAKRKKLTSLEEAQFSGKAGMTGGALARDRAGAY
jgi:hypothetical protein